MSRARLDCVARPHGVISNMRRRSRLFGLVDETSSKYRTNVIVTQTLQKRMAGTYIVLQFAGWLNLGGHVGFNWTRNILELLQRDKPTTMLSAFDQAAIDRFCFQYLQLELRLDYPHGQLLRRRDVQNDIFDRIFALDSEAAPRRPRFQLRVLKELVDRIQAGISDEEANDYEVSDQLIDRLGVLVSTPLLPEAVEAQKKAVVTYRLSLLPSPTCIDILENRTLISAGGTTGLRTWEAALHMGQFLCANRSLIEGKRVLELGAGTGYLSIICAKCLGADHVTASDGSEEVVDSLPDNLVLNRVECKYDPAATGIVTPKLLKWGHALMGTEEAEWNGGQKVDVVIGADVTYDSRVVPLLVATMRELIGLYPGVDIIVADAQRNPSTLAAFLEACRKARLQVTEYPFSYEQQHARLGDLGRSHGPLTPFYTKDIPMRVFCINGAT